MENFAFQQFLSQIYQVKPALRQYDEHVRQFLRDELKGRKSFTIDQSVVAKTEAYVQKRLDVTKVGNQVLNNEAMLFDKEKVSSKDEKKEEVNKEKNSQDDMKETVFSMSVREEKVTHKSCLGSFFWGFILGAIVTAVIMIGVSTLPEYQRIIDMLMNPVG